MKTDDCVTDVIQKLQKTKKFFQSIGWNCKILPPEPDPAIQASTDPEYDYDYTDPDSPSGIFFIVSFNDHNDGTGGYIVHISNFVIAKEDRGSGWGKKIVQGIVNVFGEDDIDAFEYGDFSNGFWKHIAEEFPNIEFKDELQ